MSTFSDITLACKDCNSDFVFDVEQQEYFASKGYDNQPTRCKACRDVKKASHNNSGMSRSRACYNCGEEGHLSSACPNGQSERPSRGRGGARSGVSRGACYNCGEEGHMSSACPQKQDDGRAPRSSRGGGSGAQTCFSCGQPGHRSFECPQGGQSQRSSGACFKCGENGHRAAECPQGGDSSSGFRSSRGGGRGGARGPRACFNCNSTEHLSYDCPQKN